MDEKLVFTYNADSGIFSTIEDYFHKIIKPQTYQCSLCSLTFGNLGMKPKWKEFIEGLPIPVEFLHRDEFISKYPEKKQEFPCAHIQRGSEMLPLVTKEEMNGFKTLDELIAVVKERLKAEYEDK
jgi:hypothetical protein